MNANRDQTPPIRKELAKIRAWHRPRDLECAQNRDIDADCTCARQCQRKPYRVVRVEDRSALTGTRRHHPKLVLSIWPNGVIKIREHGRRKEYALTASSVFVNARHGEAMRAFREAAAKRAASKKGRAGGGRRQGR